MLIAHHVLVHGRHSDLLPLTDVSASPGEITLVVGDGVQRRTALALVLSGRMKPDSGTVAWQHTEAVGTVRRHVGLVDSPDINEPEPHQRVSDLISEDLALLRGPWWHRPKVVAWAAHHGHTAVLDRWTEQLEPDHRLRLMADLTLADDRVSALVFDSPDRLTADAERWLTVLADYAARGLTVIAVVGTEPAGWDLPLQRLGAADDDAHPISDPSDPSDPSAEETP